MATMTHAERLKREKTVEGFLKKKMTVNEMARKLSISPQSMRKFLQVRGWETEDMKAKAKPEDPAKAARREKRKAMKPSGVDRSGAAKP